MIKKPKMRFGIVGAGAISQAYAQAFRETKKAQVVGVADVRDDAAGALADLLECPSYDSYQKMAEEAQMDAVVVCTPPSTHEEISVWLLGRGLHVLCEKPLALSCDSAQRMFDAADSNGVLLAMASKFRYVEDVALAKAVVTSGMIGDVVLFENAFTGHVDMTTRWNSNPEISGGGVLIDNGTHSVDIMRHFLGPLAELQVVEGKRLQTPNVEDTVRIFIRSERDVLGSIDLSWTLDKRLPNYISVYGSEGTVHVGWQESKYRRLADDDWVVFGKGYQKVRAFQRQIEDFVGSVRKEKEPVIKPADAMASVEAIETAYAALDKSRWMPISPKSNGKGAPVEAKA